MRPGLEPGRLLPNGTWWGCGSAASVLSTAAYKTTLGPGFAVLRHF